MENPLWKSAGLQASLAWKTWSNQFWGQKRSLHCFIITLNQPWRLALSLMRLSIISTTDKWLCFKAKVLAECPLANFILQSAPFKRKKHAIINTNSTNSSQNFMSKNDVLICLLSKSIIIKIFKWMESWEYDNTNKLQECFHHHLLVFNCSFNKRRVAMQTFFHIRVCPAFKHKSS